MTRSLQRKLNKLKHILRNCPGIVVAFSGGVDSSLLLKVARDVLGGRVIAVTGASPLYPESETQLAKKIARRLRAKHRVINTSEMSNQVFVQNPRNRCYHCKIELLGDIKRIARTFGYAVAEASNASDLSDFRPGMNAARRLGVLSPLVKAGLTKDDIRTLARRYRLPNWNKPSMACLASRVPYGRSIEPRTIRRIEKAERFLTTRGLGQVRVRDHFPVARIEVTVPKMPAVLRIRAAIAAYYRKLGYKYIALDLEGYQTGSMNR